MQCPNCLIAFYESEELWKSFVMFPTEKEAWHWVCAAITCPECNEIIVRVAQGDPGALGPYRVIHPSSRQPTSISDKVPDHLRSDYTEASDVLPVSAKASAALSRRILQSMLKDQGYQSRNLLEQIKTVLGETDRDRILPRELRNSIDAVRNFGNFSAHPITDATSLQVIDVDPEEAEWCLEIIKGLFEHYYIGPAANADRLSKLNQKLQKARKPPAKS